MTVDKELIDGIDGDALPERLYSIKGIETCVRCSRPLKGKVAYLRHDNNLICRDLSKGTIPFETILCEFFESINTLMKRYGIKLPKATIKRIDKILKDALE